MTNRQVRPPGNACHYHNYRNLLAEIDCSDLVFSKKKENCASKNKLHVQVPGEVILISVQDQVCLQPRSIAISVKQLVRLHNELKNFF